MPAPGSNRYLRMYAPIIEVLSELGGSGTPKEVIPRVLDRFNFSEAELAETLKSGGSRLENEVRWASSYLKEIGLLAKSEGVWSVTEAGRNANLTIEKARELRSAYHAARYRAQKDAAPETDHEMEEPAQAEEEMSLLEHVLALSPSGFERLCQRVLREAGFEEVVVTGKSGDGGIDGHGTLRLNALMSFRVIFQCKRFKGSVGPDVVRQMRGSMDGRVEKGIILTTGTFSREAQREAARDGVKPVELVDGAALVSLMEQYSLGVQARTVYVVQPEFFDDYR